MSVTRLVIEGMAIALAVGMVVYDDLPAVVRLLAMSIALLILWRLR